MNGQTPRHTEQTQSRHLATCTQQLRACGRNLEPMNSHILCPRPRHVLPANDSSSLPSSPNAITDYYQMSTGMRKGVSPTCLPVQLERITPAKVECMSRPPSADSLQYTTVLDSDCLPVLGGLRRDSALPHCTTELHYHTERRHHTTTQQGHTAPLQYDDALLCHTPVLSVASEKSSAVQGRAEQCRAEKNSEHQKVVSPTHLRSFNIYFVQSFIVLSPFIPLFVQRGQERDQRKETVEIAHYHQLQWASSTYLLPLSRALKLGVRKRKRRICNDIETNQNLTNKLNEHDK